MEQTLTSLEENELEVAKRICWEEKLNQSKKNRGFTQVYPAGFGRILQLAKDNPKALGLYIFLAEHLDGTGAIVVDQQFLATQLGVSRCTIIRWINYLEREQALVRIPIAGRVCAYCLNPHEVWRGYETQKKYASFVSKTLVNCSDGSIRRKLQAMMSAVEKEENYDNATA